MGYLVAGGGSYYFAKRSIRADRNARHEADIKRRQLARSLEYNSETEIFKNNNGRSVKENRSSSTVARKDSKSFENILDNDQQKIKERSNYEASVPYRSKKGDRFS